MNDKILIALPGEDGWDCVLHVRTLETLWPLLGRRIAFYRRLVDLTANVKAALLLSQSIYWTCHGRDIADAGGWFLKTTEQWEMETGLTLREQSAAREVLRELAILSEQRVGFPASLHFRLCLDRIEALLGARLGRPAFGLDWADGAAVAELLGPSLTYYRRLAGIGGGVHAGLLLSRALYLTRLQLRRQMQAWVGNSIAEWTEQIGLTRYEQEIARRELASAGVWEEARLGVRRRLFVRIRLDSLLALLVDDESSDAKRSDSPRSSECGISTINARHEGEASMQHSHIHVSTISPLQFQQNPPSSFDESSLPDSTRTPLQFQQNPPCSFDENPAPDSTKTPVQFQQDPPSPSSCDENPAPDSTKTPLQFQQYPPSPASFDETPAPDSTKPPLQFQQDPPSPSSFDETPLPDSTKAAFQIRQKPASSLDINPGLLIQGSTRGLVQPPPLTTEIVPCEGDAQGGGGDLILPESLHPEERESALVAVQRCAPPAQALFDEVVARIQPNAVHASFDENPAPDSTKTPVQFQQYPPSPSSFDETPLPDSTKAAFQFRQKPASSLDKNPGLLIQGSTRDLVQQPPLTTEIVPCEGDAQGGGGDLILPQGLLPEERAAALALVQRCAQHAQALLDELAARMQANAVHTSPIAYLRGLVRRALAGQFVPELGQRLATERRRNEEERVSRQQRETAEPRHATVSEDPERQARLESRRAQLRKIASALKAGLALETRS